MIFLTRTTRAYLGPESVPQFLRERGLRVAPLPGVPRAEEEELPVGHAALRVEPAKGMVCTLLLNARHFSKTP